MKRYERFADDIAELIRSGVLGPGQRVPSVRYASQTHGVSPSTVFQAYYLLERRGLIRARPRSGYFVNAHVPRQFSEPQALQPVSESTDVDVSALVFSILDSIKDPNTIAFGSAFPSPELFPLQRLSRSLASASRSMDPRMVVTDLSPGNPQLRRQIALRYMVGGLMLPMEELLITNGALEALNLCLQAVTQPGDLVAIEAPAFYACLQVLERLKLKAVEIPVHPREGMDLGVLAQTLEKHPVKAVWCMTNFQNPVGASMPEAKKQALVELLARHQVPLIEDDVYAELYYSQQAPKPAKAFDTQGLVMHCGSFAKSLAPGYRIGWVAAGRPSPTTCNTAATTATCASCATRWRASRPTCWQPSPATSRRRHGSASPPAATSCGWNCPSRWTPSSCSTWPWPKASASPLGRSFRPPDALAIASA